MHQSVAPTRASRRVDAIASVSDGTSETTRVTGCGTSTTAPRSSAGNGVVVTPVGVSTTVEIHVAVAVDVCVAPTVEIRVAVAVDVAVTRRGVLVRDIGIDPVGLADAFGGSQLGACCLRLEPLGLELRFVGFSLCGSRGRRRPLGVNRGFHGLVTQDVGLLALLLPAALGACTASCRGDRDHDPTTTSATISHTHQSMSFIVDLPLSGFSVEPLGRCRLLEVRG